MVYWVKIIREYFRFTGKSGYGIFVYWDDATPLGIASPKNKNIIPDSPKTKISRIFVPKNHNISIISFSFIVSLDLLGITANLYAVTTVFKKRVFIITNMY